MNLSVVSAANGTKDLPNDAAQDNRNLLFSEN